MGLKKLISDGYNINIVAEIEADADEAVPFIIKLDDEGHITNEKLSGFQNKKTVLEFLGYDVQESESESESESPKESFFGARKLRKLFL